MSDEPSSAASEYIRTAVAFYTECQSPPGDMIRAWLADDFAYEDRRRGPSFPHADAESYPRFIDSAWQTGTAGRPRFECEILAVRGERCAAAVVRVDYGNGMFTESIHVVALDPTLALTRRAVDFDVDDIDEAFVELDRMHRQDDGISN